ncbi:histidinol-phosphatase [Paenibacillus sp. J2TS4]|nr:histidinol-phosphatase [Paenibacillus sp. J2TS4]
MKVDFHFHLEEGPYSTGWLQRTAKSLENVYKNDELLSGEAHTLSWINELGEVLQRRLRNGCFHEEWLSHYFRIGTERGIQRFGMVDHLYRFTEFRSYYENHMILDHTPLGRMQRYWLDRVCVGSIQPFIQSVHAAKDRGVPVSLGIEADYFPGGEDELRGLLARYELDYVIGSVHFLDGWGFDNPETQDRFQGQDLVSLYELLFETVKKAAASGMFHIIAHLDNLKVFGYRPDEALLLPMYEEVAAALKRADVATEINTGLAYRYPVKEACPSPGFLQVLCKHGVPITMSSDAHFPDDIGTMLDEAAERLLAAGYTEIVYFQAGKRLTASLRD